MASRSRTHTRLRPRRTPSGWTEITVCVNLPIAGDYGIIEARMPYATPAYGTGVNGPYCFPGPFYPVRAIFANALESLLCVAVTPRRRENRTMLRTVAGLWEDKYAAQAVSGPGARHPGPRSSPAVAEGKVVTLGVGGVVSCLDAATGKVVWRKDPFPKVVPRFFASMSPIIVDGMAIAHLGGQGKGGIIASDLATGDKKWEWLGEAPQYASPALLTVAGSRIFVKDQETVVMLTID